MSTPEIHSPQMEPANAGLNETGRKTPVSGKKRPSILMRVVRIFSLLLITLIILLALIVGLGRTYLDSNPELKLQLTEQISERFGVPIKSEDLSVRWRWSGPQLTVKQLQFAHPENNIPLLKFEHAQVVLDVKRYLKTRTLGVASIELQGSELLLERLPGNVLTLNKVKLTDLREILGEQNSNDSSVPNGIFNIDDISLVYLDRVTEQEIRVENINAIIDKNDQLLNLELSADADQLADSFKVSASTPNPDLHNDFEWQVLIESESMQLREITQQWQSLRPLFITKHNPVLKAQSSPLRFADGLADVKLWIRYAADSVQAMNGTLALDKLAFSRSEKELAGLISDMGLRFSYENDQEFTHFKVDRLHLNAPDGNWPQDNDLQLKLLRLSDSNARPDTTPIKRDVQNNGAVENGTDKESDQIHAANMADVQVSPINRDDLISSKPEISAANIALSGKNHFLKNLKLAELKADYLNLDDIAPLLEVILGQLPDRSSIPDIKFEQVQGEIKHLYLTAENKNEIATESEERSGLTFSDMQITDASVIFTDLGIPSINQSMSVQGLSGDINVTSNVAKLNLATTDLVYDNLDIFRNSLQLKRINSEIVIKKENDSWRISSDNIELDNDDFNINTDLDLFLVKEKSPVLSLSAVVKPKALDDLKKYYPVKVMNAPLVEWLEDSVSGGRTEGAKIIFDGALEDYPFKNGKGQFLASLDVEDLNISYAPDWPDALLQEANITFKNQSLSIDAKKVKTGDLRSFPLTGGFPDLIDGMLELELSTPLDLQKGEDWINSTPLKDTVGEYMKTVKVTGEAINTVSIRVPVADVDKLELKGAVDFSNNPLRLSSFRDPFSNLTGKLEYNKEHIFSDSLRAIYAGQQLEATITPDETDTVIAVHTKAKLGPILGPDYTKYISGNSNVDAEIRLGADADLGIKDIKVRSNLLGSSLNLPAPFAKAQDTLLPLNLSIDLISKPGSEKAEGLLVSGNLGTTLLRSRFLPAKDRTNTDWSLHSLTLVGDNNPELFSSIDSDLARIQVLGKFPHVDFDEWLEFFDQESTTEKDEALEIGVIDVNLDQLDAIGQRFSDVKVVLIPNTASWEADIRNEQVVGKISFPRPWTDDALIKADLEKYHFNLPEKDAETIDFDPREIPNILVNIKDFQVSGIPMGEANIRMRREFNGAKLETFTISSPTFSIDGNGGWYRTSDGETSLVSIGIESSDLANTLIQLGYAPSATARSTEALIELNWPGSPFVDILQDVSGSVSFKLLNGKLQDVDPGAGRFLALLSIAQLPKRLSLDFRDVFSSGLGYDELSADFIIQNGQAYTNNMLMRGPVADLGVIGRVGLATRDFDQAAVVQADLGSSLPIAGALAGGLGVGAAMLLFSEIFKNPLKQATQVFYKIDGNWNDPQMVRTNPGQLSEVPVAPR